MIENVTVTMRFRREVGSTLVAQVIALILTGITLALVSRWLGPTAKGAQAVLTVSGQLIATFGSLGLAGSVPYFVSATPARTRAAMRNGGVMLIAALALGVAVGLVGRVLAIGVVPGEEPVMLAVVASTFAQVYSFALLLALREVALFNALLVVDAALAFVLSVLAEQIAPGSPEAFVFAQSLALGAGAAIAFVRINARSSVADAEPLALGAQLRTSFLGSLSAACVQLATRGDLFIVTALGGGLAAAGVYSVAVAASEIFLRVPQWIAQLLTPRVARAAASRRTTTSLFWLATASSAIAMLPALALRGSIESLIAMVLGAGFVPAYLIGLAMFPRIVFQSGAAMLAGHLAGRGYTPYHPLATFSGLVTTIAVDLVLVPASGPIGAAIGGSAGALVALIVFALGFRRVA
jgi:O-antigen/teichoic acid export membrane protein